MAALAQRCPNLQFHVLTTVPRWFFAQSLSTPFRLHRVITDIGLVQRTPLDEDLPATVRRLDTLLCDRGHGLGRLVDRIGRLGCRLVIADISPLGIAAARRLGIPAVLIENFTWDWIYRGYSKFEPRLERYAAVLAEQAAMADLHIQTAPVCRRDDAAVLVSPVARRSRLSPGQVRGELRVPADEPVVLLTMGGIRWSCEGLAPLEGDRRAWYVVPGGAAERRTRGHLVTLPFHSELYHPDLVQAADVVVGKLGYSTVAEVYHGRSAMAYLRRSRFPESPVLADFVRREAPSAEVAERDFRDGSWLDVVSRLLDAPRSRTPTSNGADEAADVILNRFGAMLS